MTKKSIFLLFIIMAFMIKAQNMQLELLSNRLDLNLNPEEKESVFLNAVILKINSPVHWILTARIETDLSLEDTVTPFSNIFIRRGIEDYKQLSITPVIIASGEPTRKYPKEIAFDFLIKRVNALSAGDYHTRIIFDLIKVE